MSGIKFQRRRKLKIAADQRYIDGSSHLAAQRFDAVDPRIGWVLGREGDS
ncbi:MAG: hypothetical protein OXJ37_10735 [Bryobacterales bacterium]|nr:hypothetical protein [Bryobacterales bacterium]MDE0262865.1 hypothetical protein [Bryobacterales bacterium]MDE0621700.1 hypothetical protein [Bryobacterales bacterium]